MCFVTLQIAIKTICLTLTTFNASMKISKRERVTSEENREKLKKEERIKFGQNLKERRRLLNLTQENVADRLNITVTAYSKIERGDTGVNMDRIRQLARALDVDVHELVADMPIGNLFLKELYLGMVALKEDVHMITELLLVGETDARYTAEKRGHKNKPEDTEK